MTSDPQRPTGDTEFIPDLPERLAQLSREGAAVVVATVVSRRAPVSAQVGDKALIHADGRMEGFVGGACSREIVRRQALLAAIIECAEVSVAHASVQEIDDLNILRASHLAMECAIAGLPRAPDHALIDGNLIPKGLTIPATAIVKGDAKSLSIAAASIIAKVTRDGLMVDLAQQFPAYGWDQNAGYPTAAHLKALQIHGVTPWHRRSFKPVHNILYQEHFLTP